MKKNTILSVDEQAELLEFLMKNIAGKSRTNIKSLLVNEQILVNNKIVRQYNHQVNPKDEVTIVWTKQRDQKKLKGIKIIYEDSAIIVIEKNEGILSIASEKEKENTAYSTLREYVKGQNPKNKVFIVHRLDRDTSGVMIFAKTEKIKNELQENWDKLVKERKYIALVEGKVKEDRGTIKSWLKENKAMVIYSTFSEKDGGKLAITNYEVKKKNERVSLVEVELETGRKNQIRVHMKDINHPIVGDKKYGSKLNLIKRLGLHAKSIKFIHPLTKKMVEFTSDIPNDFLRFFK